MNGWRSCSIFVVTVFVAQQGFQNKGAISPLFFSNPQERKHHWKQVWARFQPPLLRLSYSIFFCCVRSSTGFVDGNKTLTARTLTPESLTQPK
jgi:hypothetical protein